MYTLVRRGVFEGEELWYIILFVVYIPWVYPHYVEEWTCGLGVRENAEMQMGRSRVHHSAHIFTVDRGH